MSEGKYKIVFRGELAYGFTLEEARSNLKKLCKYNDPTLDKLFSGKAVTLKSKLDKEVAVKYQDALRSAGALCNIEAIEAAQPIQKEEFDCPKCGTKQDKEASCIHCGIFFEKYERTQAREASKDPLGLKNHNPTGQLPHTQGVAANFETEKSWLSRLSDHFTRHQEQTFLLKAFMMIVSIILIRETLSDFLGIIVMLFPFAFYFFIRMQAIHTGRNPMAVLAENITLMPVMYAEGERKKEGVAWLTYSLIFINILVFYGFEIHVSKEVLGNLIFLPRDPAPWNVCVSAFTHMFLHAGNAHLWGNMGFLWAVGTVVERRIGWRRLAIFYLLSGLASGFLFVVVTRVFNGQTGHLLGASGAIAGVMGIFAVRCYFKSMVFPLPILGIFSLILPISVKVRLNSLVIIGLFFLADLTAGINQAMGVGNSRIGHWAHIGGMLCGIALSAISRLNNEAIEERHTEVGANSLEGNKVSLLEGEESLRTVLRENPQNTEALLLLARMKSRYGPTEEGEQLFKERIRLLLAEDPKEATETFREYYKIYFKGHDPQILFRLAKQLDEEGDLDLASTCFQMLADDTQAPAQTREKAMIQYAKLLEEMGIKDVALEYYEKFIESFPESAFAEQARVKLTG